jgi:hypothetical protein
MIIDWLDEGPIDLEYKQYRLLSYLQGVDDDWSAFKLYPHLLTIIESIQSLSHIRRNRYEIDELIPKEIVGFNLETGELEYERNDDFEISSVNEIMEIIDWGFDKLEEYFQVGLILYEDISEDLILEPIGILSNIKGSGCLLIDCGDSTNVYRFDIGNIMIDRNGGRYVSINQIAEYETSLYNTPEQIKLEVLKEGLVFDVPNFYNVLGTKDLPLHETILPILKRRLLLIES